MNVKDDRQEFDKRQNQLIRELAYSFKRTLGKMGLGDDRDLLENLVWDVAAIVDGSRDMKLEGKPLIPCLTFAEKRGGTDLIGTKGGSWMHEICSGVIEEMFEED